MPVPLHAHLPGTVARPQVAERRVDAGEQADDHFNRLIAAIPERDAAGRLNQQHLLAGVLPVELVGKTTFIGIHTRGVA